MVLVYFKTYIELIISFLKIEWTRKRTSKVEIAFDTNIKSKQKSEIEN